MKRRIRQALLAGALAAFPAAVAAQGTGAAAPAEPLPSVTLPPELDRVLRDYERLWHAADAPGLAKLFTEDGFVLSNGNTAARGRAAIEERYRTSGGVLKLRALAHATSGNVGWIIGAYTYGDAQGDVGKFVLALRRDASGTWRIAGDMDNTNRRSRP